jgi:hypothetical protein
VFVCSVRLLGFCNNIFLILLICLIYISVCMFIVSTFCWFGLFEVEFGQFHALSRFISNWPDGCVCRRTFCELSIIVYWGLYSTFHYAISRCYAENDTYKPRLAKRSNGKGECIWKFVLNCSESASDTRAYIPLRSWDSQPWCMSDWYWTMTSKNI